jgi:hypothetical protein
MLDLQLLEVTTEILRLQMEPQVLAQQIAFMKKYFHSLWAMTLTSMLLLQIWILGEIFCMLDMAVNLLIRSVMPFNRVISQ